MGAAHYQKQTKADGKIPVNIHELWLKPEISVSIPPTASQNNKKTQVAHNLYSMK